MECPQCKKRAEEYKDIKAALAAAFESECTRTTKTKMAIAELKASLDNSRDSQSKRALIEDAIRLLKRKESYDGKNLS